MTGTVVGRTEAVTLNFEEASLCSPNKDSE